MILNKREQIVFGLGIALSALVYGYSAFGPQFLGVQKLSTFGLVVLYPLSWVVAVATGFVLTDRNARRIANEKLFLYGLVVVFAFFINGLAAYKWGRFSNLEFLQFVITGFSDVPLKTEPWYLFGARFAFSLLVGVSPLGFIFWGMKDYIKGNFPESEEKHRRGRTLLSYGEAKLRAEKERAKELQGGAFLWGWVSLPWSFGTKHFLASGSTGSGKTTLIRFLMESVLRRVGERPDERALIYDAKQDILSILSGMGVYDRVVILNPFDTRSAAWDIAADVTEPSTAQQIATILIPEEKNAAQRFFSDAARHLLSGVMRRFIKTAPGKWTLADVVYAMLDQKRLETILAGDPETASLLTYLQDARTGNSVLSTVLTKIQPYEFIAAAWSHSEKKVSLREWVSGSSVLVLGNDEAQRSALDSINQAIFKRIVELLLAQSNSSTRRSWFFLDEVREAGRLDGLQSLLTKGRSKGACVVLGFQDIDGMKDVYGEYVASEICGQCASKAFLRTDSAKTAEWAASLLGDKEVVETTHSESSQRGSNAAPLEFPRNTSKSVSRSSSENIVTRPLVMPSELMNLPLPGGEGKGELAGYYIAPNIGAYSAKIAWDSIMSNLSKPGDVPNLIRREGREQNLRPWSDADYQRLGLRPTVKAEPVSESSDPLREAARKIRTGGM